MRYIVVTGVTSGLGEALVWEFARQQTLQIVAIARQSDKLKKLESSVKQKYPEVTIFPICFDLSEVEHIDVLVRKIHECIQHVDILIHNAALFLLKPFDQVQQGDFKNLFTVNVQSVYFLTQGLLPYFARPSHIVNIASMGGVQGSVKFAGLTVYSATKAALINLTETLAVELMSKEIYVNAIAPGAVDTPMLQKAFPGYKAPLTPADAARFVAMFALEGYRYFNGKVLPMAISTP